MKVSAHQRRNCGACVVVCLVAACVASAQDVPRLDPAAVEETLRGWHTKHRFARMRGVNPQSPWAATAYYSIEDAGKEKDARAEIVYLVNKGWYILRISYGYDMGRAWWNGVFHRIEGKQDVLARLLASAQENPKDATIQAELGWALYRCGRYEEALDATEKALALDKTQAWMHANAGLICLRKSDLKAATDSFEMALALAPDLSKQAEAIMSKIQQILGEDASVCAAHYALGMCYDRIGLEAAARECYEFYVAAAKAGPFVEKAQSRLGVGLLSRFRGHEEQVTCLAFSPDGHQALSGGKDKIVRLWDIRTGTELRQFAGHIGSVAMVGFAQQGTQILSAGGRTIRVWDIQTGKELHVLKQESSTIRRAAVSADGGYVLTCCDDKAMHLWALSARREISTKSVRDGEVMSVDFSPDGRAILLCVKGLFGNAMYVWRVEEGIGKPVPLPSWPSGAAFAGNGMQALSWDFTSDSMCLWDVQNRKLLRKIQNATWTICVAASEDGTLALTGMGDRAGYEIRLWDLTAGVKVRAFRGHKANPMCVIFSPDGRRALSGDAGGSIVLWGLPVPEAAPERHDNPGAVGMAVEGLVRGLDLGEAKLVRVTRGSGGWVASKESKKPVGKAAPKGDTEWEIVVDLPAVYWGNKELKEDAEKKAVLILRRTFAAFPTVRSVVFRAQAVLGEDVNQRQTALTVMASRPQHVKADYSLRPAETLRAFATSYHPALH